MCLYSSAQDKLSMLMHVLSHNVFQFRQGFCQINATSMQIANFKDLETSENFRLLRGLLPFCWWVFVMKQRNNIT